MTPHINAKKEDIAKTVLMPGDPLRAKYIAEAYLTDYKLVNTVRNMFGYTGYYNGKKVTVMASGMGCPSIGIYSYELYKFYDVDSIIRIGTAGSFKKDLKIFDIVLVDSVYSESHYAKIQNKTSDKILYSSKELNKKIKEAAKKLNLDLKVERVLTTDAFYNETEEPTLVVLKTGAVAVEMEAFALFQNANYLKKKAACILTISDNLITKEETTSIEREKNLNDMIKLALESI